MTTSSATISFGLTAEEHSQLQDLAAELDLDLNQTANLILLKGIRERQALASTAILDLVNFLEWLDRTGQLTLDNDDESHEATAERYIWGDGAAWLMNKLRTLPAEAGLLPLSLREESEEQRPDA